MVQRKATDRVRLADVAEEAGVAISTVSRVFGNPDRVNFQTVEHVREVAERLGYRPKSKHDAVASSQRPGESGMPAGRTWSASAAVAAPNGMPNSSIAASPSGLSAGISNGFIDNGRTPGRVSGYPGPAGRSARVIGASRTSGPGVGSRNTNVLSASAAFPGFDVAEQPATGGGVIALVVKDTTDGISSQILKGAQISAMESGSAVGLIEAGQSRQRTQELLTHLIGKVAGVILATDLAGIDFIRDYARRVPLVVLNRPVDGVPSVVPDPRIGVVRALSLLRSNRHTAVTYISGTTSWSNQSRWSCLHDVGQRMGFRVTSMGPVQPTVEGGFQAALALEGAKPTAVVTYNDLIAAGIVLRLTADGVRVPEDVSVIGFDNTLIAPVGTPPITSIRIPRAQIGQEAVRLLLGREPIALRNPADAQLMDRLAELGVRNEDEQSDNVTLVDTSIIVRRSVGACRAVRRAVAGHESGQS